MKFLQRPNYISKKQFSFQFLDKPKIFAYWVILLIISITLFSIINGRMNVNSFYTQSTSVNSSAKSSSPMIDSSKSATAYRNPYVGIGVITTPWKKDDCYKRAFLIQIYISNISQYENEIIPNLIIWEYYDFNGNYHIEYNTSKISIGREYEDRTELFFKITMFLDEDYGICKFNLRKTYTIHISGGSGYYSRSNPTNNVPSDNSQPKIGYSDVLDFYSNYISTPISFADLINKLSIFAKKKLENHKKREKQYECKTKSRFEKFSPYT